MKIEIRSITDIITNSSSETYCVVTHSTLDAIKAVAEAAIALAYEVNSDKESLSGRKIPKFEDIFGVKFDYTCEEDEIKRVWDAHKNDSGSLGKCKTLEEFAIEWDTNYNDKTPLIDSFTVVAKNPKFAQLAKTLNVLNPGMYEAREVCY